VLFGAGLPLPLLNANRRAIREATATRDAAKAAVEAAYEELIAEHARLEAEIQSTRLRRHFLEREVAPLVDEQVADARRLDAAGDVNTLLLLDSLTRSYDTKLQVLRAALDEASALSRLAALYSPGVPMRHETETNTP